MSSTTDPRLAARLATLERPAGYAALDARRLDSHSEGDTLEEARRMLQPSAPMDADLRDWVDTLHMFGRADIADAAQATTLLAQVTRVSLEQPVALEAMTGLHSGWGALTRAWRWLSADAGRARRLVPWRCRARAFLRALGAHEPALEGLLLRLGRAQDGVFIEMLELDEARSALRVPLERLARTRTRLEALRDAIDQALPNLRESAPARARLIENDVMPVLAHNLEAVLSQQAVTNAALLELAPLQQAMHRLWLEADCMKAAGLLALSVARQTAGSLAQQLATGVSWWRGPVPQPRAWTQADPHETPGDLAAVLELAHQTTKAFETGWKQVNGELERRCAVARLTPAESEPAATG